MYAARGSAPWIVTHLGWEKKHASFFSQLNEIDALHSTVICFKGHR